MPRKAKAANEADIQMARVIGGRIKAAREQLDLSPKEFGLLGGVSQAQQYRIESGERVPDALYLAKLVVAKNINIDGLFFDVDKQTERQLPALAAGAHNNIVAARGATLTHADGGVQVGKVFSKHGHAAGRDVNVNQEPKIGKGNQPKRSRSGP